MKLTFIGAALCFLITACGGGGGGGGGGGFAAAPAPAKEAPPPICTVELNGDSILHGQALDAAEAPAKILKALRPQYTVQDKTVGGQTAKQRAALFNNDYRTARVIVIQHGTNDLNRFVPEDIEPALKSMGTYAKAEGRIVVLTGMSKLDLPKYDEYSALIRKTAADIGAIYAGWDEVEGKSIGDGIHPDVAFNRALVEKLALALDRALPECR